MTYFGFPGMKLELTEKKKLIPRKIIALVAGYLGVSVRKIMTGDTKYPLPAYRYICCYYIKKHCNISIVGIARLFKKDHTTILYGLKELVKFRKTDPKIAKIMQDLDRLL